MARRSRKQEHENHERWLVSYADFITLLFAFFVVMFASSQTDKGKAQQFSDAMKEALDQGHFGSAIAGILGGTPDDKGKGNAQLRGPGGQSKLVGDETKQGRTIDLKAAKKDLEQKLLQEINSGKMQLSMEDRGLVISFQQSAFFPSGTDEIPVDTYPAVQKVADLIRTLPNPIRCEGHTDAVPVRAEARFQSNWELSAARAIAMMELIVQCCDVPRARFSIAGYADNAPVADNNEDTGRQRNRRVDIVVLSETGTKAEPTAFANATKAAARAPKH